MTQLLEGIDAVVNDEPAFVARLERHRRELHLHCYRMVGSFDEADDLVQETLIRAWRRRERLGSGSWFRAWLYRIATNACLESLGRSSRRTPSPSSIGDLPGLQPYPDRMLDEIDFGDIWTDAVVVSRKTIELAYVATIQLLPPRQRAALILNDVLGWSMRETAGMLDTTIVAANSALQRARATLRLLLPAGRPESPATEPSAEERALLGRFIDAHERADAALRLLPTAANRQPAAASYVRAPGAPGYRAFKLDVLRIERGAVAEITTFDAHLFHAFGLPLTL